MVLFLGLAKAVSQAEQTLGLANYVRQHAGPTADATASPESHIQPTTDPQLTFSSLSLPQQAALWLQNRKGFKNADRRACIEEGTYIDPFEQPEVVLQREWVQLVQGEVQTRFSKVRRACLCLVWHL